ncbi:hypothetical protein ABXS75_10815 [Roseburia hominis]
MNKLSISVYEKLIEKKATSKEIDFVLYLARYQNAYGEVEGVYYRDICEELGISAQGFYDLKESLIKKEIIVCLKRDYTDWDITLLDNEFPDEEAYKKGYFQLHAKMFSSDKFRKMRAGAKLLAMDLYRFNLINKSSHEININKFFSKYQELLGVRTAAVRLYLTQIKEFFYVNIVNKNYYFKLKKDMAKSPEGSQRTERQNYQDQIYRTVLRRNRIKRVYEKAQMDVMKVLNIYHRDLIHSRAGVGFTKIVKESLEVINKGKPKAQYKRVLRPSLINKLLGEEFCYA